MAMSLGYSGPQAIKTMKRLHAQLLACTGLIYIYYSLSRLYVQLACAGSMKCVCALMFGLKAKVHKKRKVDGVPPEPADPPPWMKKDETHLQEQLVNALLSHAAKEEEDEWMAAGSTDGGWWVDGIWWEKDKWDEKLWWRFNPKGPWAGWSRFKDQRVPWQTIDLCVLYVLFE